MEVARKLALAVCEAILLFCIGLFVLALLFRVTIGNPELVKSTLSESGIYTVTTNNLKEQLRGANADIGGTDSPIIPNAVDQAIKTGAIQNFIESGIMQTYAWLEGTTETPQFSLDINQIKTEFADAVAAGLTERAATLPACSARVRPTTSNIFTINCIPPGTDATAEIEKIRQQILATDAEQINSSAPLSAEALTAEKDGQQQPYYQSLKQLPGYYQALKAAIFVITGIFLLMALLIVLLKRPRFMALRTLSIPFMIYGILYIIAGYFVPKQLGGLIDSSTKQVSSTDFGEPLKAVGTTFINHGSSVLIKTGAVFFIIGVVCLAAYIMIKRKQPKINTPKDGQSSTEKVEALS